MHIYYIAQQSQSGLDQFASDYDTSVNAFVGYAQVFMLFFLAAALLNHVSKGH